MEVSREHKAESVYNYPPLPLLFLRWSRGRVTLWPWQLTAIKNKFENNWAPSSADRANYRVWGPAGHQSRVWSRYFHNPNTAAVNILWWQLSKLFCRPPPSTRLFDSEYTLHLVTGSLWLMPEMHLYLPNSCTQSLRKLVTRSIVTSHSYWLWL